MRYLSYIILAFILSACDETTSYHLLYPIEASKQEVLRIKGYRFLSSNLNSPASILVLSNPIENGGFADFALAITNNGDQTIHLSKKDFIIKMRAVGELDLLSSKTYAQDREYIRPEGFDTLAPKMQAYGCATSNTKDNIQEEAFNTSQAWVWDKHKKYPFKDTELYLRSLDIPSKQTKGTIFRIALPKLDKDFKQSTILVDVSIEGKSEYKFKFILQSLQ